MKIIMIEACEDKDAGSVGAAYVAHHARTLGHTVDVSRENKSGYDIELISVHHSSDFRRMALIPKLAKYRLMGGHVMQNNPLPAIPFADAICIGDGESWIKQAINLIEQYDDITKLQELAGTIICGQWERGMAVPKANAERPLPDNPPILNWGGTNRKIWYIEIARGCPYRCHYCELGHSAPYRRYQKEHIKQLIDQVDYKKSRQVNFFAPDEASHPDYNELFDYVYSKGCMANYSSMRIESVLHKGLPDSMKTNYLIRCGIDGLTQETRLRVRKPITHEMILKYFSKLIARGHIQFKMFMIFGYPWEELFDFQEFANLIHDITHIDHTRNFKLRIKWTPFIPQPKTPLANAVAKYDHRMVAKIKQWHSLNAVASHGKGWFIQNDGLMNESTWRRQCEDVKGDELKFTKLTGAQILQKHFVSKQMR